MDMDADVGKEMGKDMEMDADVGKDIKQAVLAALTENEGAYVSGIAMEKLFSTDRGSIWKAIQSLRTDGYEITALPKRGYMLVGWGDILTAGGIKRHIKAKGAFMLDVRETVRSTNTLLSEIALQGAPEGYVIVADGQTAGKGRMGKDFFSPTGHGAYFSILLRPRQNAAASTLVTPAAAVAAARAIEKVSGFHVGIKWVNDLYLEGKKVCGILTEARSGMEAGKMDYIVVGIGINVTRPEKGFTGTLAETAGYLREKPDTAGAERCKLIAATLDGFWGYYQQIEKREYLDEYRARSIVLGKKVSVIAGGGEKTARALEIDDDCGLLVRYEDGSTETLRSGSVSVKQATAVGLR